MRAMRRITGGSSHLVMVCIVALSTAMVAAARTDGPPERTPNHPADRRAQRPRARNGLATAKILSDIRRDAARCREKRNWDLQEDRKNTGASIPNDVLIRLLGRNLHPDTSVDAYIKWRLMAFDPDLSRTTTADLKRLAKALPTIAARRVPRIQLNAPPRQAVQAQIGRQTSIATGQQSGNAGFDPTLSVVNSGASVEVTPVVSAHDPRYVTMSTGASLGRVGRIRRIPVIFNVPVMRFRTALVDAMPAEGGLRLMFAMQDAADRIAAGDPSFHTVAQRVVTESQDPAIAALDAQQRNTLRDLALQLARVQAKARHTGAIEKGRLSDGFSAAVLESVLKNLRARRSAP